MECPGYFHLLKLDLKAAYGHETSRHDMASFPLSTRLSGRQFPTLGNELAPATPCSLPYILRRSLMTPYERMPTLAFRMPNLPVGVNVQRLN